MKVFAAFSAPLEFSLKSWLIMKVIGFDCSHALIIINGTVYHHVGKGIVAEPLAVFSQRRKIKYRIDISDRITASPETIMHWLGKKLGQEYSQSQYWGFVFKGLQPVFKNGRDKGICSEFVAEFYNTFCGGSFTGLDFLSPGDVYHTIRDLGA